MSDEKNMLLTHLEKQSMLYFSYQSMETSVNVLFYSKCFLSDARLLGTIWSLLKLEIVAVLREYTTIYTR